MRAWSVLLAAALACAGGLAQAARFEPCEVPHYLAFFDTALTAQPCEEIAGIDIATAAGTTRLTLIRLAADPMGDPATWLPLVEQAARAIGRGIDAVGVAALPREVTVLMRARTETVDFDPGPGVDRGVVHAHVTHVSDGECFVSFFKGDRAIGLDEFTFSLSHEVFHCAQIATWPDKVDDAAAGWWREGSAEYFAHLVQPGYPARERELADGFDRLTAERGLLDIWYETVVFFSWLHARGGPHDGVGAFLAAMPEANGRGAQLAALRGQLPLDAWAEFIETWLDGGVAFPGGAAVPRPGEMTGTRTFSAPGDIGLPTRAYAIPRWTLWFARERLYELDLDSPDSVRVRVEPETAPPWQPVPLQINACLEERPLMLYAATVEDRAEPRLSVDTDADRTGAACCMIGDWLPTPQALQGFSEFGNALVAGMGPLPGGAGVRCEYLSGDWRLSFKADRTGQIVFADTTNACTMTVRGTLGIRQTDRRSGALSFAWRLIDTGEVIVVYGENTLISTVETSLPGPLAPQPMTAPIASSPIRAYGIGVECTADSLIVRGLYPLTTREAPHIRAE